MKFAKRLGAEASRRSAFAAAYLDYKTLKSTLKQDLSNCDACTSLFMATLQQELCKVSQFYSERADKVEEVLRALVSNGQAGSVQQLQQLRTEIKELIKFAALNYLAVVKAIKKRNRHLRERFGAAAVTSLEALDLLGSEVFFASPRLAHLATQADVLCSGLASTSQPDDVLEEYQCPICLDTLHNPVVLTCAHRFCWGCLVAHVTAVREQHLPLQPGAPDPSKGGAKVTSMQLLERIAAADEPDQQRYYNCPVCRKPQLLDVDSLSVDPFLSSFIESLKVLSVNGGAQAGGSAGAAAAAAAGVAGASCAAPAVVLPRPQHTHSRSGSSCSAETLTLQLQPADQAQSPSQLPPRCPEPAVPAAPAPAPEPVPWGILPPQHREHRGKLCVLLDLDGTLVSSYTPRRAPRLPHYVRTHLVGVGSKLNPAGVFVVERPGLREFLEELATFAEVVVFTAGLEDYAKPIVDAIDPRGRLFAHRIYREGTLRTDYYQCVKDMARVNRDLSRTVLVDDTPLAFLHQPDNGVPVLGFRADPDDRLLLEAVLPLMQVLAKEADVRPVLQRRFDMTTWFRRNSFPIDSILHEAAQAVRREQQQHLAALAAPAAACAAAQQGPPHALPSAHAHGCAPASAAHSHSTSSACASSPASAHAAGQAHGHGQGHGGCLPTRTASGMALGSSSRRSGVSRPRYTFAGPRCPAPTKRFALVCDFDKTLIDHDTGEAVCELLAPELLPMLVGLDADGPANYIPITNTILAEMQRRGVSRDALLSTLQSLGAEMPLATVEMLRMMHGAQVDVKILSDCNSVFISHMLAGAKVAGYVQDVVTNPAAFERAPDSEGAAAGSAAAASPGAANGLQLQRNAGHRLVIRPCFASTDPQLVPASGACAPGAALQRSASSDCAEGSGLCCAGKPAGGCPCRGAGHGCTRCPDNLCKGLEVRRLQHQNTYAHIVYCGDGMNDVCAALELRECDVVLARSGHALARYLTEAASNPALPQPRAQVAFWSTHEELLACVRQIVDV